MPEVFFTPNSEKIFQKIRDKKLKARIGLAITKLSKNPFAGEKLKGVLSSQYKLKVWPYRIIYFIRPNKDIVITDIGHRKDVYR
jgi:mRNA-degrading endonuclease RelE of RelBE toxin-antitoxin system